MPEVISRRDLGSSNPFFKFFRQLKDSIKGIFTGLIFIVISFVLVYFMATQKEHSKTIADLPLLSPTEAEDVSGMVKVKGEPTMTKIVVAPNTEKDALYYTKTIEEFQVEEVTRTRVIEENGREIEETYVEYETDWTTVETETKWSEFELGNIEIRPGNATLRFNTETFYENTDDLEYNTSLSMEQLVGVPQKRRETVTGVAVGGEIIAVGENSGGVISSGVEGAFFLSNMSESEFIQAQEKAEKMTFWIMAAIAWILMTSGFTMLLGPITHILSIIPGLGELTKGILGFVFGIISAIIIFFAYIGMKYWWLILIGVILVVGFLIFRAVKKEDGGKAPKKSEGKKEK